MSIFGSILGSAASLVGGPTVGNLVKNGVDDLTGGGTQKSSDAGASGKQGGYGAPTRGLIKNLIKTDKALTAALNNQTSSSNGSTDGGLNNPEMALIQAMQNLQQTIMNNQSGGSNPPNNGSTVA